MTGRAHASAEAQRSNQVQPSCARLHTIIETSSVNVWLFKSRSVICLSWESRENVENHLISQCLRKNYRIQPLVPNPHKKVIGSDCFDDSDLNRNQLNQINLKLLKHLWPLTCNCGVLTSEVSLDERGLHTFSSLVSRCVNLTSFSLWILILYFANSKLNSLIKLCSIETFLQFIFIN